MRNTHSAGYTLHDMTHFYRETWGGLVGRYTWPALDDPHFDELTTTGWDEIHALLLDSLREWLTGAHIFAVDLETTLTARAGVAWWREDGIGAVETFLASL